MVVCIALATLTGQTGLVSRPYKYTDRNQVLGQQHTCQWEAIFQLEYPGSLLGIHSTDVNAKTIAILNVKLLLTGISEGTLHTDPEMLSLWLSRCGEAKEMCKRTFKGEGLYDQWHHGCNRRIQVLAFY